MKLRNTLFGLTLTSALALSAAAANAADMYAGPGGMKDAPIYVPNWGGFYVGAIGGFGWQDNVEFAGVNRTVTFASIGLEGGYQIQRGNFVLGIEADGQAAQNSSFGAPGGVPFTVEDYGSVRGRIGYAWGPLLVFGTGGFAFGTTHQISGLLGGGYNSFDNTGYAVGGGIEYKLAPSWSVKVEYLYTDLGRDTTTITAPVPRLGIVPIETVSNRVELNTIRFGVNWHLVEEYAPLK